MPITPNDVVAFWRDEVGPAGWYEADQSVDAKISERFGEAWRLAHGGALEFWRITPTGTLGYLIVTDQFSRNMFRGRPESFVCDPRARSAANAAIERGWDMEVSEPLRQFFYLPFIHSECMADQDRGVCLMKARLSGDGGASNLLHARAHREIIRRFSRFPFRNAALGRTSSAAEALFLKDGGYGAIVRALQARELEAANAPT